MRWGYNILFVTSSFSPAHDLDKIIWNTAPAAEVTARPKLETVTGKITRETSRKENCS